MSSSRERLLAALKGKEPDCVPVVVTRNLLVDNLFTREQTYRLLVEHVRKYGDIMFKEHVGTVRYLDLYPRFNPDISARVEESNNGAKKITLNTPKGPLRREVKHIPRTIPEVIKVTTRHYIQEEKDIDRYLSVPYKPVDVGIQKIMGIEKIVGNRGVIQITFWDPVGAVYDQINPERFAIWSIQKKSILKDFIEVMYKRIHNEIYQFLEAGVGEVFYFNGPEFILPPNQPPEVFDEFISFYDSKLISLIHKYGKLAIIHCHGKVANFLEKFVDIGADAVHPLEAPPMGNINIREIKKRPGNRICLIGNIQYTELIDSSPEEIEIRVKRLICDAGAGGGLIVSPCCGLYELPLPERTAKNYIAMIDAVRKYGVY